VGKEINVNNQHFISTDKEVVIIGNFDNEYNNEAEEDLFIEIIRASSGMEGNLNKEEYGKILEKLEEIRPLLSEEQNGKLDKALELLSKEA